MNTIVFKWTADNGDVKRTTIEIEDGTPIYVWESGNTYHYGDLVIYASEFYRCITENSDTEFDGTKWNEIGSPDGNYDIVQTTDLLPARFTSADRKIYYVIADNNFYLWNGSEWVVQVATTPIENSTAYASSGSVYAVKEQLGNITELATDDKTDAVSAINELQSSKQDNLTFDNEPIEYSDNPVKSGGVYAALDGKVDKVDGKGLSANDFTDGLKDKLDAIEDGAEVNVQSDWAQDNTAADDFIKNKPDLAAVATSGDYGDLDNTPDIPENTSDLTNDSGFITKEVDDLDNYTLTSDINTALGGKVDKTSVGIAGGVAELDATGKIPTSQLPSSVDEVLEYGSISDFPEEGEAGKIYVTRDTNLTYRWGGTMYVEISESLALGETMSTAYRGDRGKTAYDHSQVTSGNPHNVTAAEVGLGNVDNTADVDKPISNATKDALDLKQPKILSAPITIDGAVKSTVESALSGIYEAIPDISGKQNKTLDTPLTINGTSQTTVEGALGGIASATVDGTRNFMGYIPKESNSSAPLDANDFTTPGFYSVYAATTANMPDTSGRWWTLEVTRQSTNTNFNLQKAQTQAGLLYIRNRNNGTWSGWTRIATASEVDEKTNYYDYRQTISNLTYFTLDFSDIPNNYNSNFLYTLHSRSGECVFLSIGLTDNSFASNSAEATRIHTAYGKFLDIRFIPASKIIYIKCQSYSNLFALKQVGGGNKFIPTITSSTTEPSDYASATSILNDVSKGGSSANGVITVTDSTTAIADDATFTTLEGTTNPTSAVRRTIPMLWTYIKGKISSVLGLSESSGTKSLSVTNVTTTNLTVNTMRIKQFYSVDASSLDNTKFYPVFFAANDMELDCEIHSPNFGSAQPYNQNVIHFLIINRGWSDTPKSFELLNYNCYDNSEITIGCIGAGQQDGGNCVWVRGGFVYRFFCNQVPSLKTADYTVSGQTYTVGTNYYGGTNSKVNIIWTPLNYNSIDKLRQKYTYVICDTQTLQNWVNNTSGHDYSRVFVMPGTWSLGATTFKTIAATTYEVCGAGKQSVLQGIQLKGCSSVHDLRLVNGCLYSCRNVHNIEIEINRALGADSLDISAWAYDGSLALFGSCANCSNIRVEMVYDTTLNTWVGMNVLRSCSYMSNICVYSRKGSTYVSNYDLYKGDYKNDEKTGLDMYALIYDCSCLSDIVIDTMGGTFPAGIVAGSSGLNSVVAHGKASEYAALQYCSRVTNCEIELYNDAYKGGSHICPAMNNCWNITNNWIYAHNIGTNTDKASVVGFNNFKVMNNYIEVDNTSTADASCTTYASSTTNSSYKIADTANGGFNNITTLS